MTDFDSAGDDPSLEQQPHHQKPGWVEAPDGIHRACKCRERTRNHDDSGAVMVDLETNANANIVWCCRSTIPLLVAGSTHEQTALGLAGLGQAGIRSVFDLTFRRSNSPCKTCKGVGSLGCLQRSALQRSQLYCSNSNNACTCIHASLSQLSS
jgi:hypothetical protein